MQQHPVHYRVMPSDPAAHLFTVELTIQQPNPDGQRLSLPAWIPGSYMIRDFARNIVTITAECCGRAVTLHKIDKQAWQADPCDGALQIRYTVYAWDLSVRSAHFDQQHAYFNGTSLFLRVAGQDEVSCSVELLPPEGDEYQSWCVATTLPLNGATLYGFGGYQAADYDELIDHPVEMADFTLIKFEARGTPHEVAITGKHYADCGRIADDLKKICEYDIDLFGELPEMARYLFQVMAVGEGYGGLEHRSSTSLLCSRDDLPVKGGDKISEGYRNFLGLCAHEYFHTWNVKRIKPAVYLPYDLQQETHTPLLWFFEGVTSYYDDLTLYRSGCIDKESYLELLGQQLTRLLRTPGRNKQTVSDSSFDAWTKLYKADENATNAIVSYYNKGAVVALCLDLTIRKMSNNRKSLDDVMRALWQHHGKPLIGVSSEGLEQFISEVSGVELKPFFDLALRSTDDLPVAELLCGFNVTYHTRPADGADDKGGKAGNGKRPPHYTGLRLAAESGSAKVTAVLNGSPAHLAGISAGDVIIAVDWLKSDQGKISKHLARFAIGDSVVLHGFRRDELKEWTLVLDTPIADTVWLSTSDSTDKQLWHRSR
ncbi:MAG: PDZ domain-containing protein [Chromatiales bacterium]|nr:PDZ domain-containing protein [Chromatiales bacterium]